MASRRMIDPNFWQSESLMELDYRQRLLFIGLISNADDQGRLKGNAKLVKAMVFPFDDISADEVQADLSELEAVECIAIYKVGSKTCIQIVNWWSYQHPQWAYPSELPAMEGWKDQLRYRSGDGVVTVNWLQYQSSRDDYGKHRYEVYKRDGYQCIYCGGQPQHLDHIIPKSKGGSDDPKNLATSCARCNTSKGNKDVVEWYEAQEFYNEDRAINIGAAMLGVINE